MTTKYEQFLLDRKSGLGGSDIAAIMGLSPWKTALDVYLDKTSEAIDMTDKPHLKEGREREGEVLNLYKERHNVELETDLEMKRDSQYSFLFANVDAKVKNSNVIIEAKTTRQSWNGLPEQYQLQCAHYAMIYNSDYVDVASLNLLSSKYTEYTYYRDERLEKKIRECAINFWHKHVLAKVAPEAVSIADCKSLFQKAKDSKIKATAAIYQDIVDLKRLQEEAKELETQIANKKLNILKFVEDNEAVTSFKDDSIIATYRNQTRRTFDSKTFQEEHSELAAKYMRETSNRVLRVM